TDYPGERSGCGVGCRWSASVAATTLARRSLTCRVDVTEIEAAFHRHDNWRVAGQGIVVVVPGMEGATIPLEPYLDCIGHQDSANAPIAANLSWRFLIRRAPLRRLTS